MVNEIQSRLSEKDTRILREFRRSLHKIAERSGKEERTAASLISFLSRHQPDDLVTHIGGHSLAAIFKGKSSANPVLLRADLDALPIPETIQIAHGSATQNVSHKCGHDGHMAMLAGVAPWLAQQQDRPTDVVLLFQGAEETGHGAMQVLKHPRINQINPRFVFAIHNLPGFPLGQVFWRKGVFASASTGLVIDLQGRTSHAAQPHLGNNPSGAMAEIILGLSGIPQHHTALGEAAKVTIVHAVLGEIAFGTSPGTATVAATLRTYSSETMKRLSESCVNFAKNTAQTHGLACTTKWVEPFPVTENHDEAIQLIVRAANGMGIPTHELEQPFPWSEDFGHFTHRFPGALFGLGAGEDCPALHDGDYDFPDTLISIGTGMWISLIEQSWRQAHDV
jgi:amidohydrolase